MGGASSIGRRWKEDKGSSMRSSIAFRSTPKNPLSIRVRPKTVRTPMRLVLVRHGESQGNVDHTIYRTTADNALHLTKKGFLQAIEAGESIKQLVGDESVRFFVSPYVRTRETFNGIAKQWGGPDKVKWTEDPRLREQDFGNFQDPEKMALAKKERNEFGRFYYRFDQGESGADVYDRVSGFMDTLWRYWNEHTYTNYILVIHGLTIAVFLMRWFKYDVDKFHTYANFTNCEYCVLENDGDGKMQFKYCVELAETGRGKHVERRTYSNVKMREINSDPPGV